MVELDEILITMAEQLDETASILKDNANNITKEDALKLTDIITRSANTLRKLAKKV